MTSVSSVSPRLISAVSGDPAGLLAAAAAELANRWAGDYDLTEDEAVACIARIRDALQSLSVVLEPGNTSFFANVNDCMTRLADDGDPRVSVHAEKRAAQACYALHKAVRELSGSLDRHDGGVSW